MLKRYAYAWITLSFFLISFILHWWLGWHSYVSEAAEHGQTPVVRDYLTQMGRDTFENWQSEFLQLLWQVVGLAYFLYVGSPSSKENDDRTEAKIDTIMRMIGGEKAEELIQGLDWEFERHSGHAPPHSHGTDLINDQAKALAKASANGKR